MGSTHFVLEVDQPFRLDLCVWTLRRRSHNIVDRWEGDSYRRVLRMAEHVIEVVVSQASHTPSSLLVEVRSTKAPSELDLLQLCALLRQVLGLDVDLGGFYRLARQDVRLSSLAKRFVGMRPPRFPSVFEALVNAIACQQLSLTVGIHLLNRLAARFGPADDEICGWAGFPLPAQLAEADHAALERLGFSRAKARAIVSLATQVASGQLDLEALERLDDDAARDVLLDLVGVGRWSAEYTLLRGLGRLQVLPGDDVGARNNLRRRYGLDASAGYGEVADLGRQWSPYGGLVYFHLLLDALAEGGQITTMPLSARTQQSFALADARTEVGDPSVTETP